MRHLILGLMLALTIPACGDDGDEDLFTWGDASLQLSTDFCEALATCGYFGDDEESPRELQQCISHTNFHLCVIDGTCDEELPDGSEELSAECGVAMETFISDENGDGCFYLGYYGVVPEECGVILDLNPKYRESEDS